MGIILCCRTWHDRYGGEGGVLTEHVSGAQCGGRIRFRFSKSKHSLKTLIHSVSWRVSGRRSVRKCTVYLLVLEFLRLCTVRYPLYRSLKLQSQASSIPVSWQGAHVIARLWNSYLLCEMQL